MSWDGRCEHGVYIHPRPAWEKCSACMAKRVAEIEGRRKQLELAFGLFIDTGDRRDLADGVARIYEAFFGGKRS